MISLRRHPLLSTTLTAFALLAPACLTSVQALVELPSGKITLQTTATGTYDSYMIGTTSRDGDYIATLMPKLSYDHLIGPTQLNLFGAVSLTRYYTNTQYNSNDLSGGISSNLPVSDGSRISGKLSANYSEFTQVDQVVNDRVPTKSYLLDFNTSYRAGLKTSFSDSVEYNRLERHIYGNQEIWSNNFGFTYSDFLENTNLTLSHVFTRTKSSASNYASWVYDPQLIGNTPNTDLNQTSNQFSLGLAHPIYGAIIGEVSYGYVIMDRGANETTSGNKTEKSDVLTLNVTGPLLPPTRFPKIESSASIAYSQAQSPGINDSNNQTVVGNLRIAWNARERTRLSFGASRNQALSTNNFTSVNNTVIFGVVETIGLATTLNFDANYSWRSYRSLNRHDNMLDLNTSLHTQLTQHWSSGISYEFQDSQSDAPNTSFQATRNQLSDFTRHVVSASLSCSY